MKTVGKVLKMMGILVLLFFIITVIYLVFTTGSSKRKYSNVTVMYPITNLNIRKGPSTNYDILKVVEPNSKLLTTDSVSNNFIMVLNDDSTKYGWTSIKYLQAKPLSDIQMKNLERKGKSESRRENVTDIKSKDNKILEYKIINKSKIGLSSDNKAVIRILVSVDELPSENEMKNTATVIWKNGNRSWEEFTVFIYLPGMDLKNSAYGIVEFTPSGLSNFFINKSNLYGTKWE